MASNWNEYVENQKILLENLKQNPHIKFSDPKNRLLYPEEYARYKTEMQVAENNKKYGHTQGVIKSADPTKPHVAKMVNRQNALEFAKKHPKIDKLLHFIPLVNLAWTDMKADPDTPAERKAVAQAAVTDVLSLAGLGKVVKSAGVIPAVSAEAAGIAGAYGGSELGEYLVQEHGAPEWTTTATTIIGGGIGGGFGYKLPGTFVSRGIFPDKAVQKGLYSAEYVKTPLTRIFDNQIKTISPETHLVTSTKTAAVPPASVIDINDTYGHAYKKYKPLISWDSDHRAKISEGERLGLPKSLRVVETPEYLELKQIYNEFANKYGYPEATARTYDELVRESRKLLNRHNTFSRGVYMTPELIAATPGMSDAARLRHAATVGRYSGHPGDGYIWVSPGTSNAAIYGANGETHFVRIPVDFDGDPVTWFKKYEFSPELLGTHSKYKGGANILTLSKEAGLPYTDFNDIPRHVVDDLIARNLWHGTTASVVAPWALKSSEYLIKGPLKSVFKTTDFDAVNPSIYTRRLESK